MTDLRINDPTLGRFYRAREHSAETYVHVILSGRPEQARTRRSVMMLVVSG